MFQRLGGKPENLEYLQRIEVWVRQRFALRADQIVLVSEEESVLPGFSGPDTTIRFWVDADSRYRIRIFKRSQDVIETDLPPAWLLPGLRDDGDPDCC